MLVEKQKIRRLMNYKNWIDETGAATAEYAIATMAAVAFAGLLVVIMRSPEVKDLLFGLVKSALTFTNPNG
jgi:Flp pilus assembly pilin Flp